MLSLEGVQHVHEPVVFVTSCHGAGNCVAAGLLSSERVVVRDTKDPERSLVFTPAEWDDFLKGVKAGEFDRAQLREAREQT